MSTHAIERLHTRSLPAAISQIIPSRPAAPAANTATPQAINGEAVVRLLAAAGVRQVRLEFADLHGIARSKLIPLKRFDKVAAAGTAFYGGMLHSDARGDDLAPAAYPDGPPALPDYLLTPDLTTLAVLHPVHASGTARVVCELCRPDGTSSPASPRWAVRNLVSAYEADGLSPELGFEYEFSVLDSERRPSFPGRQYSSTLRNGFAPAYAEGLFAALERLGVGGEGWFVEAAPGQVELPLHYTNALRAADHAFALKTTVKELGLQHCLHASFMTKPAIDEANNALHVHQSLVDARTGANAFARADGEPGLSLLGERFLAGQLAHARALCAFLDPTINCYKSFKPHVFAPSNVSWGFDNRFVAIRVPSSSPKATRIENRIGGAAADPYVAAVALLAAGLDGIRRRLTLPSPSVGDITTDPSLEPLPRTLDDALDALERDDALHSLLPEAFVDVFLTVKRDEARRCRDAVPDYDQPSFFERIDPWEFAEYGDLI
jgi:glutamine synthetase